jgi:hypothetical protein
MSLKVSAILPSSPVQPDGEVAVAEFQHHRQQLPIERPPAAIDRAFGRFPGRRRDGGPVFGAGSGFRIRHGLSLDGVSDPTAWGVSHGCNNDGLPG